MKDLQYNKEITQEELKSLQLQILDEVDSFCCKNGITYFLSSGTLIGAIRHKGFIPWDDDIDLYMPRKSYEIFLDSFNEDGKEYRVISLRTDPLCSFAYAKVERLGTRIIENVDHPMRIGVNIDIFPIDGVPDDEDKRKRYFRLIHIKRAKLVLKDVAFNLKNRSLLKNVILLFGKLLLINRSLRSLAEELDSVIIKDSIDSRFVCNMVLGNGADSIFYRSSISDSIKVQFEGKEYPTMIGFDDYLTKTYGDYMKLPPDNLRVSHHSFYAYWV